MRRSTNFALKEQRLFRDKRFIFLGESIHGVAEYTRLRENIAERYFNKSAVLIFEADSNGMLFSHQHNESAICRLKNFPGILRSQETVNLLAWAISRQLPCLGIDSIPRRSVTEFPPEWQPIQQRKIDEYSSARSGINFFAWREIRMAENLIHLTSTYPEHRMLIMLHNLHIKRHGSFEKAELRLKSVREYFEDVFPRQSHSIAQLAQRGSALHNDLTLFNFHITDPLSVERLSGAAAYTLLTAEQIPNDSTAWHHAFERETVSPKNQYEGCFIFKEVHPPIMASL
ncbi:hypothetical protein [Kosakonia pseudosacchari]|uniref:Erythromycin esterase family protein n=1 Tax=Kosakonia pseudosacchari TaxID=1646340 RepID=A0ABX4ISN4_9ENTR|nr:hypothetical protein [Kosakonia pseudosacchari]PDO88242.1 hypothetical protein BK796_06640 [Kosakonia pseudosacchari]